MTTNKELKKRRGRPSRLEAAKIQQKLLETALNIFMVHGFEKTTMEEIATSAAMSKRTLYSRYKDKNELFLAAMEKAISNSAITRETVAANINDNVAQTLFNIAKLRFDQVSTLGGIRLQRLLTNEAFRFPGLLDTFFKINTGPTLDALSEYFEQKHDEKILNIDDSRRTAIAFLTLSLGGLTRRIITGHTISEAELNDNLMFNITLFLNGTKHPQANGCSFKYSEK